MEQSQGTGDPPPATDDDRLGRLLDYTKFHIGIYLTIFSGMAGAVAAAAADGEKLKLLSSLFAQRWALIPAALFMAVAGFAGGIIASSCTQEKSFDELWNSPQGPGSLKWWPGRAWALLEHSAFWISLVCLAVALLASSAVLKWLRGD